MRPARERWINPALALALCAAAGAAAAQARVPLPWMIGPLVAMAACNFAGTGLRAVRWGRESGQVVIGTALGLYFTPAVAREVAAYWPLLLAAGAFAIALGVLGGWLLSRLSGADRTTSFFASVPGGATEMTLLGERFGARVDRVALAQSLRITVVVVVVPVALSYAGVHGADAYRPVTLPVDVAGLALLLATAAGAGALLHRVRMPNAFMFGPLAIAVALTGSAVEVSAVPGALSNAAQVLLGCALGARFDRRSLQSAPRFALGVLASVMGGIVAAAAFAAAVALGTGLPLATLVLAMAPGGIAEMCITAKVLQLGVPLVTAAHVTRVLVLILTTGPSYRAARRIESRLRGA